MNSLSPDFFIVLKLFSSSGRFYRRQSDFIDYLFYFQSDFIADSLIPILIMGYLYRKISRRMLEEQTANNFLQSRLRNRRALRTIRGLIILFSISVFGMRILLFSTFMNLDGMRVANFYIVLTIYYQIVNPLGLVLFYSNNILNIFIYAKMIAGFRRFLLTVLTCGMYERRRAVSTNTDGNDIPLKKLHVTINAK